MGQVELERQQGPGYMGPRNYIEVFWFLFTGLQRTTARWGTQGGVSFEDPAVAL